MTVNYNMPHDANYSKLNGIWTFKNLYNSHV